MFEEGKTQLPNYAFTQRFAFASQFFRNNKTVFALDYTRYVIKTRNYCQLADEKKVKIKNKILLDGYRYWLRLKATESTWQLIVTNTEHFYNMDIDLLSFQHYCDKDLDQENSWSKPKVFVLSEPNIIKCYKTLIFKGFVFQKMITITYQGLKKIIQREKRKSLLLQS